MDKYLKISDFIVGDVSVNINHNGDVSVQYDYADPDMIVRKTMDAIEHAINSHDELVESMQHYKQEAEQWEARATNEASRAQDFEDEVDRLRREVVYLSDRLEKHMEKMIDRLNK